MVIQSMLTIIYAAETPPNALKSFCQKSIKSKKAAIPHAGTSIGIGNSLSVADGLLKIIRKIKPLKMAVLPS